MLIHALSLLFGLVILCAAVAAGGVPSSLAQWCATPALLNQNTALGRYLSAHPEASHDLEMGTITLSQCREIARDVNVVSPKDLSLERQVLQWYTLHIKSAECIHGEVLRLAVAGQVRTFELFRKLDKHQHKGDPQWKKFLSALEQLKANYDQEKINPFDMWEQVTVLRAYHGYFAEINKIRAMRSLLNEARSNHILEDLKMFQKSIKECETSKKRFKASLP